jgi:phosphoglycolate phosphatase
VLFDLDGTLLDTVGDISTALNRALEERGWTPLSASDVRRMIGRGSPVLIERAAAVQGRTLDDATRSALLESFFRHYGHLEESGGSTAQPYPGAAECLRALHRAALRIAVVTNKHERFARGLLERSDLRVDCVIGGDSFERRKPDPGPLLFACERLNVAPSHALMVGDSINDVQAARGAQMPIICVPYGYNEGEDPRKLACDAFIESLADLPGLLMTARS